MLALLNALLAPSPPGEHEDADQTGQPTGQTRSGEIGQTRSGEAGQTRSGEGRSSQNSRSGEIGQKESGEGGGGGGWMGPPVMRSKPLGRYTLNPEPWTLNPEPGALNPAP